MNPLPLALSQALETELSSFPLDELRKACADLTHRYASGLTIETTSHRYAYLAARFPATYGVAQQLFQSLKDAQLSPSSLLDLGAGAGTMIWAASKAFPPLQEVTCLEKDPELIKLGQRLTHASSQLPKITWKQQNLSLQEAFPSHDMVVLSYVLNELSLQTQNEVVERAYKATDKLLILIEPGTPQGFATILSARRLLLEQGAYILAPCSHNVACPLTKASQEGTDWCHFSVRIPREQFHKLVKDASLPYEDEKYSYLVVSPHPSTPLAQNRIIKAPLKKTGHIILDLCTHQGTLSRKIISKRDKEAYTQARTRLWGGIWRD